jgi:hypothetical protein
MIVLSPEDILALHYCYNHGGPVEGKEIVAMTGLDPRQLIEAKIIRRIGRFDSMFYKGENWPAKPAIKQDQESLL